MNHLIGSLAYRGVIRFRTSQGRLGRGLCSLCNRIRQRLIRHCDPVITMPVGGQLLKMHLSHQLPLYSASHPLYDRALPRISSHIADALGHARVIDVGANIGDTAAALLSDRRLRMLCVEGDDKYFPLLLQNTHRFGDRVYCVRSCCDEHSTATGRTPVRGGGTTRFVTSAPTASAVPVATLDTIVAECPQTFVPDLLKVDTDGFDFKVLRGADELIRTAKPAIYFEWQPEFLALQSEDARSIFPWLSDRGYESLLLYDNLGRSIAIQKTSDDAALQSALSRIIGRQIHYYDVLTVHRDAPAVIRDILRSELAAAGSASLSTPNGV